MRTNHKLNNYSDLIDYILSRTLIVFFFKITFGILKNIYFHITSDRLSKPLIEFLVDLSLLILMVILINIVFTLIRTRFKKIIQFYYKNGLIKSSQYFFKNFFVIFTKNFTYEFERDDKIYIYDDLKTKKSIVFSYEKNKNHIVRRNKLSSIFYVTAIISVLIFKGNPFVNNYYGIYNNYVSGLTREGEEIISEDNLMVIDKKNYDIIDLEVKYFVDNYSDNYYNRNVTYEDLTTDDKKEFDRSEIDFSKRGYLFQESAFFDGYSSYKKDKDFISRNMYFGFYILEKALITLLFFFLPFIAVLLFYFAIENKKKHAMFFLLIIPVISFFGYPSETLQSDIYTTCLLIFIGLINLFPLSSIYSKLQNKLDHEKLIKMINVITIVSIVVFVIVKGYLIFWNKLFLVVPLLIWWLIVSKSRELVEEE